MDIVNDLISISDSDSEKFNTQPSSITTYNVDKNDYRHMNRFKYTKATIRRGLKYLKYKYGKKPKYMTYYPALWCINDGHLTFDNKIVVSKQHRRQLILQLYYDELEPYSRDGIHKKLLSKYIGISRPYIQTVIRDLKNHGRLI